MLFPISQNLQRNTIQELFVESLINVLGAVIFFSISEFDLLNLIY